MDWNVISALVERVQAGDEGAFTDLYEQTLSFVRQNALSRLKNKSDVDDVVQEVYIEVHKSIGGLQNSRAFGGWLKKIVQQKCARFAQRSARHTENAVYIDDDEIHIELADEDIAPDQFVMEEETKTALQTIVEDLPKVQQDTLKYYYYNELKIRQIAELMDCSENTVKSRLSQGKKKLADKIYEKRKQGISFPAILPLPLLFRLIFGGQEKAAPPPDVAARELSRETAKTITRSTVSNSTKMTLTVVSASMVTIVAIAAIIAVNGGRTEVPVMEFEQEYTREQTVEVSAETFPDTTSATTPVETEGEMETDTSIETQAEIGVTTGGEVENVPETSAQTTAEPDVPVQWLEFAGQTYPTDSDYISNMPDAVVDLPLIVNFPKLESLFLYDCGLTDISPLGSLANIKNLNLDQNKIQDLSALAKLPKLEMAIFSNNQISDISPLANCTQLLNVGLANNNITNISPLAGNTSIKTLSLQDNKITDISALAKLDKLEHVVLNTNQIADISSLKDKPLLTNLHLDGTNISDISPLAGNIRIELLSLHYNKISDVSSLATLTNLKTLDLSQNQISDISPLMNLKNLESIDLRENPVSEADIAALREALPNAQITF